MLLHRFHTQLEDPLKVVEVRVRGIFESADVLVRGILVSRLLEELR